MGSSRPPLTRHFAKPLATTSPHSLGRRHLLSVTENRCFARIPSPRWRSANFRHVRKRLVDRRCRKAEEARREQEITEHKEQEDQRRAEQRLCRERCLNEYDPPPKTCAGQVIAGALVGTGWRWVDETIDGEFVVLGFVIGRGFRGRVSRGITQPVLEAARKHQSSSYLSVLERST